MHIGDREILRDVARRRDLRPGAFETDSEPQLALSGQHSDVVALEHEAPGVGREHGPWAFNAIFDAELAVGVIEENRNAVTFEPVLLDAARRELGP